MNEWKIVWRKIGWFEEEYNTIREGWAAEYDRSAFYKVPVYAWIEDDKLAIHDDEGYYPSGRYDVPLSIIEELKNK